MKKVDSVTFNTASNLIKVVFEDGSEKEYGSANEYLADFPDRLNDVKAMGW